MSPPIRSPEHQRRLKAALAGGVLGVVATDHAPFNSSQKRLGEHDFRKIPNGVNGIEERLHVTWDALVAPGAPGFLDCRAYGSKVSLNPNTLPAQLAAKPCAGTLRALLWALCARRCRNMARSLCMSPCEFAAL